MKHLIIFICLKLLADVSSAQSNKVSLSGAVRDVSTKAALPCVTITLRTAIDSSFVAGTVSREDGRFQIPDISQGHYLLTVSYAGYKSYVRPVLAGQLSNFLDLGLIGLSPEMKWMDEVTVNAQREPISPRMDKKTFILADNISQAGGSALEAMRNLPGITTGQDGQVQLRGSNKVMILVDGKQTALTGFGSPTGLDNIPASSIEKIEIINNPSSRYDANGNAGIINIIYKKEKTEGFNGKASLAGGLGALWVKKENYPTIRPQYRSTPKVNPSVSMNYRKNKINLFFQGDDLYTQTLNKNEFTDRYYDTDGSVRKQQIKRNRNTNFLNVKTGADFFMNPHNTFTISGLYGREKIIDRGDEPFFDADLTERKRLWQFVEDELKTTVMASLGWQHKFPQPGRSLNIGFNYTFHREDEKYNFTNILPAYTGADSFKLLSDEHVADLSIDYVQPLKQGRFETGFKFRRRYIPVNMQFKPGVNSALDASAGGKANYGETIPALYGNYIFETGRIEAEAGLRIEHVNLEYDVNPFHPVYKSDGYNYLRPFPNVRLAYKLNDKNKFSVFCNRRVDRPNEVDIRIFPKYDDAEIIKVGNPALRPQFTNTFELAYKTNRSKGYLFASVYHKRINAFITRIGSIVPGSIFIYNIFQNAGRSYNTGMELMVTQNAARWASFSLNLNGYRNIIDSFTVVNKYPAEHIFTAEREAIFSGNIKLNTLLHLPEKTEAQLTIIYQAPDLLPQGKNFARFSIDAGIKKSIQKGKGELFANATDIANTLQLKKEVKGEGFRYISTDYYETQVIRIGYSVKF